MKSLITKYAILLLLICGFSFLFHSCKKKKDPIKYKHGLFPENIINLYELSNKLNNNFSEYIIEGSIPIVFPSSNNRSELEQGIISFIFDQTTGDIEFAFEKTNCAFTQSLINKAVNQGNNTLPYRFFCIVDGFEYFIFSSENAAGRSDFFYMKNRPVFNAGYPVILGPHSITLFNSTDNDTYISFNNTADTAYFSSDRDGNFDIYMQTFSFREKETLSEKFELPFSASVKPDSVNSSANDKSPFIHKNVMLFSSDRLGGFGGYDLYYSVFRNGKWSAPTNFGLEISTAADEINPILGSVKDFKNSYMIFSRYSEEKNEYELYFTGIYLPK